MSREQEMWQLMEFTLVGQILLEKSDSIPEKVNRFAIKKDLKSLLKNLEPIVDKYYTHLFSKDEQNTQSIMYEYETLVSNMSKFNIPEKTALSQYVSALSYDRNTVEGTIHRVIKKHNR